MVPKIMLEGGHAWVHERPRGCCIFADCALRADPLIRSRRGAAGRRQQQGAARSAGAATGAGPHGLDSQRRRG
eukprot:COSAG01_NODE_1232_length_11111_cov_24.710770_5_plen_73_part_00